jgi:hypothetical protein
MATRENVSKKGKRIFYWIQMMKITDFSFQIYLKQPVLPKSLYEMSIEFS